jgi:acyl-CoA reductase-like NAD-dependent aldehyde dehydrogenase
MPEIFLNYVGGRWAQSKSGKTFPNINPANTDEVVGLFQASNVEDAENACVAASEAFTPWSALPAPRRGEFLFKTADILDRQLPKIAEEMTREEGKTLPEAKAEVRRAVNIFRYFAGEGSRELGHHIPSEREEVVCYTSRKPLGVVSLIAPWNFPVAIPAWKMAPALIAGNTVVIKPASQAPLGSYRVIEALDEAGIPAGVVNYVTGSGAILGDTLVDHPAIKAVSFTGSCETGAQVYDKVTRRRIRVQLEMGGKNPTVVLKDADLDYAASVLINGAFYSTGQKCTACSRAIIERPSYEALVKMLVDKTRLLKVGNGLEPGIDIGPAVDAKQLKVNLDFIEVAKQEGAHLLCGGKRLTGGPYDKGYFIEPTIFGNVKEEMRIAQEEVFGPVLSLMVADDFEDAMRLANAVKFGLSASIISKDLARVYQFINGVEAGVISVNLPTAGIEYQLPFGGTKESSFGMREQGPPALDFYTESRTIYLKYS